MKKLLFLFLLVSGIASAQYTPTGSKTRFVNGIGLGSKLDAAFSAADSLVLYTKLDSTLMFKYKGTARALAYAASLANYLLLSEVQVDSPLVNTVVRRTSIGSIKINMPNQSGVRFSYAVQDSATGEIQNVQRNEMRTGLEIQTKKGTLIVTEGNSMSSTGAWQAQLYTRLADTSFVIVNHAVSGSTTQNIVDRISETQLSTPKYFVILADINDIVQGVAEATIESNLQAIYTAAKGSGATVIAAKTLPFKGSTDWTSGRQIVLDNVNAWISSTATNVDYIVDSYTAMEDPARADYLRPSYSSSDSLHPNSAGYVVLGNTIYSGLAWAINVGFPYLTVSKSLTIDQDVSTMASPAFRGLRVNGTARMTGALTLDATAVLNKNWFLNINPASQTTAAFAYAHNTSGDMWFGLEGSTGNGIFAGTDPYSAVFGTSLNKKVHFVTNNVIGQTINGDGSILIPVSVTTAQYKLSALNTAPSSASDTGTLGEIRIDANYIYICTATNTWKRVAIATW